MPISGRNPRFQETLNLVRPHLLVMNKMDIADRSTNDAVKATLMKRYGVSDILFVSCKQTGSIKHKVRNCYYIVFFCSDNSIFNYCHLQCYES